MPFEHIVYLWEGLVKIHMKGPRNTDQILKITRPLSFIGLPTLLGDSATHYSATALIESRACYIESAVVKELIQRNGHYACNLIKYICKEELTYFQRFVDQQQKQLRGRLADALLFFRDEVFDSDSFQMDLTKSDLAALTGTSRKSIARALKSFREDGILETTGNLYHILNKEMLVQLSHKG